MSSYLEALSAPARRKKRPYLSHILRAAVYRRDDFTCQSCGVRPVTVENGVEMLRTWNHGDVPVPEYDGRSLVVIDFAAITYLTLDHIVPYSHGGSASFENLQTMCGPCNSRKGAKV